MRRSVYVSGGGFAGVSLTSFLAQLPIELSITLLVLAPVSAGFVYVCELGQRDREHQRDHALKVHAIDRGADPALIEALGRHPRS